jgi:hypothetical protein
MAVLLFQNWAGAPIEGEGVQHRRHFGKEASPKHHGGDPEANNELSAAAGLNGIGLKAGRRNTSIVGTI